MSMLEALHAMTKEKDEKCQWEAEEKETNR